VVFILPTNHVLLLFQSAVTFLLNSPPLCSNLRVTRTLAGAGVGVTFHPRVGLGGCHGCGHGRVFVKPTQLPSLSCYEL
jgi:hypothetical protein